MPRCSARATGVGAESRFLGLDVNGREVSFAENVLYQLHDGKIVQVWPVIDKAAIGAQL
jgi:predicted ester cyclase